MNKVAYWRAKRGLTVRKLAERTLELFGEEGKINPASITRIEKGRVKPYLSTLGKLAAALDVDVKDLVEDENNEQSAETTLNPQ